MELRKGRNKAEIIERKKTIGQLMESKKDRNKADQSWKNAGRLPDIWKKNAADVW